MHTRTLLTSGLLLFSYASFASAGHAHGGGHCHSSCHSSGHAFHSSGGRCWHGSHVHYRGYRYSEQTQGLAVPLKGEQDFSAGVGYGSVNQLQDSTIRLAGPTLSFNYSYYFSKALAVSVSAGFQTVSGNGIYQNDAGVLMPYNYNEFTTSAAAGLTWLYSSNQFCQVYGGIALGVTHYMETDVDQDGSRSVQSKNEFGYQVTGAGIRFGHALGGFAELGVGYKGIVNCGLSYQSGWKKTHAAYMNNF